MRFFSSISILLLVTFAGGAGAAGINAGDKDFPFRKEQEICRVWEWVEVSQKIMPLPSAPRFKEVYYVAPTTVDISCGSFGVAVTSIEVPELGVLFEIWGMRKDKSGEFNYDDAVYAYQAEQGVWLVAPTGFVVTAGVGYRDVVYAIVYHRTVKEDVRTKEYKIVSEYRVRYSSRTITHIILKIIDPHEPEKELKYTSIELAKTPIGNKTIQEKEVLR